MGLLEILSAAQGGELFAAAGQAAGVDADAARNAMSALCPAIALALRKKAEIPEAFDALLDVIEDGDGDAFLDDPTLLQDAEVVTDGNAILKDLYGSQAKALKAGQALSPQLDKPALAKLMPIAASAVLAALVRSQSQPMALVGAQPAASTAGGGLFGSIVSAVIEGAVKGAVRELTPKTRRRRTSYSTAGRRKTTTRKKRTTRPALDDIFRQILGSLR